jgi:ABC-type multidrug transport system fused ATPase/permease subunit
MVRLIQELLRPHHRLVAIVAVMMLLQATMGIAGPWPLKIIIDSVVGDHAVPNWATWFAPPLGRGGRLQIAALAAIITVIIAVASSFAGYLANYVIEIVAQRVADDLRLRTYHHLQTLSRSYYAHRRVGSILSTIITDVKTIEEFASLGTVSNLVDIFTLAGMLAVMVTLQWDFALIAVALLPFLVIAVSRVRTAVLITVNEVRRAQADMVATVQEGLQAIEVVQALQGEDFQEQQLARISERNMHASIKARRVRALLTPVVNIPIAICTAFVLWRGSALILAGALTLGSLTVFAAYLARFFGPVQSISVRMEMVAQAAVAVARIRDVLEADVVVPERSDATDPPPFRGDIAFEHVAFGYHADRPILRDVNFTVRAGELVGIVGTTGCGKSTLVSLIPRSYDATAGTITIDGSDIRGFTLRGLRGQIGVVLQETVLFGRSVRDNIAFGHTGATDDEVVRAAKLANADEFITRMPHGYDSIVGDRGLTLSVGERQRIGIARALIRDNPILILDEPTAALDAESELLVIEAMERLMKGRTVICIAHRLSTIRNADRIIGIKDGFVVEEGSPEELLARNGLYSDLHRIQFKEADQSGGDRPNCQAISRETEIALREILE